MKVYIKNMVCNRCIMVVKSELEKLGFHPLNLKLGEVELEGELVDSEKLNINNHLRIFGFELIDDKRMLLSTLFIIVTTTPEPIFQIY